VRVLYCPQSVWTSRKVAVVGNTTSGRSLKISSAFAVRHGRTGFQPGMNAKGCFCEMSPPHPWSESGKNDGPKAMSGVFVVFV
jgi:hypothetical protein